MPGPEQEPLVRSLAEQLGRAFVHEAKHLRERALALASGERTRQELAAVVDHVLDDLRAEGVC